MLFRTASLLIVLTYSVAFSQSSTLKGVVSDDTGNSPTGIYVVATLQSPSDHRTFSTVTTANGAYSLNLPAGAYSICLQEPGGGHLNNCNWSTATQLTLGLSQTLTQNLTVAQGAIFQLRLDDPKRLITPTDDLLVGIFLPKGFSPMRLAASDPTGRTYDIAVPLKTAVRLNLISTHLQIADDKGKSLGAQSSSPGNIGPSVATSALVTFPGQSALHGPPLTFTVTGRN